MTLYPSAQQKAQAEISAVVGMDRLPTMEDMPYLPYLDSLLKEVHRIHPVTGIFPHATLVDDEYNGCENTSAPRSHDCS